MKDIAPGDDFINRGGSELCTMSTTTSLEIALSYAASSCPTLLRLKIRNFMERGAEISWLSAFPAENEVIFAPLTYMQPDGVVEMMEGIAVVTCTVSS